MNLKPGEEHEELMAIGLARQNVYQARSMALPDTHFVLARLITINSSAPYLVLSIYTSEPTRFYSIINIYLQSVLISHLSMILRQDGGGTSIVEHAGNNACLTASHL